MNIETLSGKQMKIIKIANESAENILSAAGYFSEKALSGEYKIPKSAPQNMTMFCSLNCRLNGGAKPIRPRTLKLCVMNLIPKKNRIIAKYKFVFLLLLKSQK